ncbi:MAG TPA: PQQ-dependent sugar dehydrogenase [Tepidisphaeraceae bacterium]|nr:PQQ-dependent sugar dehydrogenase [Tepidisphaeraceae bacterium]
MRKCRWLGVALAIAICGGWHSSAVAAEAPAAKPAMGTVGPGVPAFVVRPGYRVTMAVPRDKGIPQARFLTMDPKGTLYISEPQHGTILACKDPDANGVFQTITKFVIGKPLVQGMQFFDGYLWFATSGGIYKARDTKNTGMADEVDAIIPDGDLPHGGGHWYRSLLVTPDGFYTSIGDTGNDNDLTKSDREKIWLYSLDGKTRKLFISGIRNTEKLMFRPGTDEVWGCDHGSDNFGHNFGESQGRDQPITDYFPPDEFNHYVEGGFYGHPFIVGDHMPRPEYANRPDIVQLADQTTPPAWDFGDHWAPDGWTWLHTNYFPEHKGDALIAFHGSWNRSTKSGYCIQRILFDPVTDKPYGSLKIVDCLTPDGNGSLERPVDLTEAPDGSVYFSGDQGNCVYHLTWAGGAEAAKPAR